MKEYTLVLTGPEVVTVAQGLDELPYKTVALLMAKLQKQIQAQNDTSNGDAKSN